MIAITGQLKEAKHDIPMVDNGSHDRVLFLAAKPFGYHSVCYAGCQVKGDLAACGLRHSRRGYFFASDISSTLELRLDMLLSKLGTFRFRSSLCCDLAGPIFSGTSQCVSILQERFLTCKANSHPGSDKECGFGSTIPQAILFTSTHLTYKKIGVYAG